MKLTLKTVKLQELVSKAIKGCSNDKMIPLTGLMSIELKDHQLTFSTTDAVDYLYVTEDKVEGKDFSVVVTAETFAKLISKMTSENVNMELSDNHLNIKGNGEYKIELPLDEEGEPIKFPNPLDTFDIKTVKADYTIQLSTIRQLLTVNKPALATDNAGSCYEGYYAGESVVTTDSYKICGTSIKLFDEPVLIRPEMMNLLDVMDSENIKVYIEDDTIVFATEDCVVYGKELEGIDEYKIDAISGLLDLDFPSECSVSKDAILQTLDRLSLFVGPYDKNGVYLTFTRDGLSISSKKSSGTEIIPFKTSKDFKEFTACINIEMLQTQVKAHVLDEITIQYGLDNALKIVDGNVTQIIAYIEDDRVA